MAEPLPSGSHTRGQHPLAPHKGGWWSLHICGYASLQGDLSMKLPILPKGIHQLIREGKQKPTQLVILEAFLCLHKSWSAWVFSFFKSFHCVSQVFGDSTFTQADFKLTVPLPQSPIIQCLYNKCTYHQTIYALFFWS